MEQPKSLRLQDLVNLPMKILKWSQPMTEIQQTNIAVANYIIDELHKDKPFNLVLDAGQTGSLFNIAAATDLSRGMGGFIDSLVMALHKRVNNGTGVILEINSNADLYYHMLSSYIAKFDQYGVVKSLGEVS